MDRTKVYFDGTVDDLFTHVRRYLESPDTQWPDSVAPGNVTTIRDGWRFYFVEPVWLSQEDVRRWEQESDIPEQGSAWTEGPRVGHVDIERITDQQARLVCRPLTNDCRVFTEALAQYVAEALGAELRPADTPEPASTEAGGEAVGKPGRQPLDEEDWSEYIYRLAMAEWAEETKKDSKKWAEVAQEIGWRDGYGKAAVKKLYRARKELEKVKKQGDKFTLQEIARKLAELKT